MLTVHYFLRDSELNQDPDKALAIYYQLEIEGQDRDTALSTRIKIPHKFWWNYKKHKLDAPSISKDGKQQWIMPAYFEADEVNEQLHTIRDTLKDIFKSLQTFSKVTPTYSNIREIFDPKTKKAKEKIIPTFLEVLRKMIVHLKLKKKRVDGTITNYEIREKNITDFLTANYSTKILITEVKHRHIEELQEWMSEQTKPDGSEKFGLDHRNKHATCVKQTLEFAVNKEYLTNLPVSKLGLTYSKEKPPAYLTPELRKSIAKCKAVSVQKVRDVAIFLMHTGFSYVDFLALKSEHLHGACWKKERDKSEIFSLPPLLPEAAEIINKYGSVEALPRIDISDMNKELKHLGDFCNINEDTVGFNLSTSVFRETFASMMENEYMFPRSDIKFMMGHKTERQLKNYSSVMPGRILHGMQKHASTIPNDTLKAYSAFIEELKKAS